MEILRRLIITLASKYRIIWKLKDLPVLRNFKKNVKPWRPPSSEIKYYEWWREKHLLESRQKYHFKSEPALLSLLTSAFNTPVIFLDALAKSVYTQEDYENYEWIVLDNGSTDVETVKYLQGLARQKKVKYFRVEDNLGIIGGMKYCAEKANGKYILPLDSDDYLYPDCLRIAAFFIEKNNYPALLYSDEDKIEGKDFYGAYFKPDWDPVLFLNSCYIAHLCAINRELALKLGVYTDRGVEGCHDWDTFLRFMLNGSTPVHIPEVIYSWRMHDASCTLDIKSKPYVYDSHRNLLNKFIISRPDAGIYHVELSPLFSGAPDWRITRDHVGPATCFNVVLGDGYQKQPAITPADCIYIPSTGSGVNELQRIATKIAKTNGLIFFRDETVKLVSDDWLWEVLTLMELHPDVVMVGGRVHNKSRLIICAGEYFGFEGYCYSPEINQNLTSPGYFAQSWKQRSVSAVSTMLSVVKASFLTEFLEFNKQKVISLAFMGAWLGAFAMKEKKRIVYSPYLSGVSSLSRSDWDRRININEIKSFVAANKVVIPDTRFLSQVLSLDIREPYIPVLAEQRENILKRYLPLHD